MITSSDNKQVKEIVKLNQKGRARKESGLFVTEGEHLFWEVPEEELVKVYVSEDFTDSKGRLEKTDPSKVEVVSGDVFKKMTDTLTPQGVLCLVKQRRYSFEDMTSKKTSKPIYLILEGLQDPGNLGTIMRTAEGAGVSGIIMSKDTVDLYNPKTVRSTQGSIFRVPFLYTDDLKGTIEKIKALDIPCFAAHLKGKVSFKEADYSKGAAFMIGNEGNGLTDETAGLADEYIIIPMQGQLESLNAAVSAALLMYAV